MTISDTTQSAAESTSDVFGEIVRMLGEVLGEYGLDTAEITRDTTFHNDLELESIDLVMLAGLLGRRYGDQVNVAQFLADKDLDDVIALRIGDLVDHVVAYLRER